MKTRMAAFLLLCIVAGGLLAFGRGTESEPATTDVAALREKVQALEERVASLEKRIQDLRRTKSIVVPRAFPEMRQLPPGWQEREFNGVPYYIIPVEESSNKAVQPMIINRTDSPVPGVPPESTVGGGRLVK